ncbi:nucleic acid-binding protein, partial [Sistotremastrum niveocremeum HHB9708]
ALRPVTIKQILTCEQPHADAEFVLDNAELTSIAIVAQIRTIQHGATNMKLTLSDGTGTIDARKWNENGNADGEGPTEEDKLREAGIVEDAYIYAMGSLKTLSGKRSININTVRLVESPYEVFYHIHHAMVARLYYTRGPPNGTAPGARGPDGDVNMYNTGPNGISGYSNTASPYARAGSSTTNGAGPMTLDPQYATLSPLEKGIVSAILQQRQGADGVNVSAIARSLQGQADANAIS